MVEAKELIRIQQEFEDAMATLKRNHERVMAQLAQAIKQEAEDFDFQHRQLYKQYRKKRLAELDRVLSTVSQEHDK